MSLTVLLTSSTRARLVEFRSLLNDFPGRHEVVIRVESGDEPLEPIKTGIKVEPCDRLIRLIRQNFGFDKCDVLKTGRHRE